MKPIDYLLILAVLVFVFSGSVLPPDKAVLVYESEGYTPPAGVAAALSESGLDTRVVDQDVVTGDGKTPADVAPAINAAKKHGLPAVVLLRGGVVVDVFSVPETAEALREALE